MLDFPNLKKEDLLSLNSEPYQLREARSYLDEVLDVNGDVAMSFVKQELNIIGVDITKSVSSPRRIRTERQPHSSGPQKYCCQCKNGDRTVRSCAHVASVVYYLSYARYQPVIRRPAHRLTDLFTPPASDSGQMTMKLVTAKHLLLWKPLEFCVALMTLTTLWVTLMALWMNTGWGKIFSLIGEGYS